MYSIYEDLVYQLENEGTTCATCGGRAPWQRGESLIDLRCRECRRRRPERADGLARGR